MKRIAICVGTGPSLTFDVGQLLRQAPVAHEIIAVNDAWRRVPWCTMLYACDAKWWQYHKGVPEYGGMKVIPVPADENDPLYAEQMAAVHAFDLMPLPAKAGLGLGIEDVLHYGQGSGYQAINLAYLLGHKNIALVGYDMSTPGGVVHFFGDHPPELRTAVHYHTWPYRQLVADLTERGVEVFSCTPGSALHDFIPYRELADVIG